MKRLLSSTAIAGALLLCGLASGANAVTVSISSELAYSGSNDAPIYSVQNPNSFTPLFILSTTGSTDSVQRSPYETNSTAAGRATAYSVLSPGPAGSPPVASSATYNLTANNFTILWGSPDDYNTITFYDGINGTGTVLGTFSRSNLACGAGLCDRVGWDVVTFLSNSAAAIGSVVLRDDGTAAFEYGLNRLNNDVNPTPLPAAVWLFGTVIAGAAGASRLRRKRKAA